MKTDTEKLQVVNKRESMLRLLELYLGITDIIKRLPLHSFPTIREFRHFEHVVENLTQLASEIEPVLKDAVLTGKWNNPELVDHCEFIVHGANQCGRFRVSQELPD